MGTARTYSSNQKQDENLAGLCFCLASFQLLPLHST
jgi:hypothetical protein